MHPLIARLLANCKLVNCELVSPLGVPSGSGTSTGGNTGDVTIGAYGATPTANGATIAGQVLTLQPADLTNPGLVTLAQVAVGTPLHDIAYDVVLSDNLITPPGAPVTGDAHLAAATGGGWTAGHIYEWNGAAWLDVLGRAVTTADYIGIAFDAGTVASGGLTGKEKNTALITNATPGAYTYTFTAPSAGNTVLITGVNSTSYGEGYEYNGTTATWNRTLVPSSVTVSTGLQKVNGVVSIDTAVTVDKTTAQSLTNKTLVNPIITDYTETAYTPAVVAGAVTIDWANGTLQKIVTAANTTITLPAPVAGKSGMLLVAYGGAHTLTFAGGGTITYPANTAPTATSAAGKMDAYSVVSHGATYTLIADAGRNYTAS